jgi:hemolysin activation/secretion protein
MSNHPLACLLFPCALGLHASAWSQNAPDAGSVRQQIEQQREQRLPPAAPAPTAPLPTAPLPSAALTVTLQAFSFTGNQLLTDEQLAAATAGFLNRPLAFADLQRAADAVAIAYREAGWLARVLLPEQDLGAGTLTLQIIEARYGGLRFEGKAPARVSQARIEALFDAVQQTGQPLNVDAIDRALLLATDLPGANVSGTLSAGVAPGETLLVLRTTDERLVSGDVGLDNAGPRSTGSNRLTANITLSSALGQGELLGLNLLHTRGTDYGRAALSLPVGRSGLRLGVNASEMRFKTVAGPGYDSAARIKGRSSSVGVDANYPLVRSRMGNLFVSAALDMRSFLNSDLEVQSDYDTRNLNLGLAGNRFDDWGGGGAFNGSVQLGTGRLHSIGRHPLQDSIGRSFNKLSYSLSRQQTLADDHSLWLSLTGQYAKEVLDSSEKFYIGGSSSVRAYPATELGGERGYVVTGEWRWRVHATGVLSAFADFGRITTLAAVSGQQEASLRLRGHGLSASWQGGSGLLLKATWARRDGRNPMPTAKGTDGDGTLRLNRLWLSANFAF